MGFDTLSEPNQLEFYAICVKFKLTTKYSLFPFLKKAVYRWTRLPCPKLLFTFIIIDLDKNAYIQFELKQINIEPDNITFSKDRGFLP